MTLTQKHTPYIYAVIVALVLAIYGNTINHEFVLDDTMYIVKNEVVQNHQWENIFTKSSTWGFDKVNEGAYRPLVLASFVFDHVLFGDKPNGYHAVQVVFYAVLCVCLFVFLRKLLKADNLWIPTIITLVFVAHPIHTEVVANVKSRDEIFGMLFLMISGIAFLNSLEVQPINSKAKNMWLLVTMFTYLLALLSKETYVALLLFFPALVYFSKLDFTILDSFKKAIWFLVPLLIFLVLRSQVLDNVGVSEKYIQLNNNMLAGAVSFQEELATAIYFQWLYLKLSVWSSPLICDYSFHHLQFQSFTSIGFLLGLAILVGGGILFFKQLKNRNLVAFGVLVYFSGLVLVSNIVIKIPATFAERFLFLPSLGIVIIVVWGLRQLKIRASQSFNGGLFLLILIVFSSMTFQRGGDWKDSLILYKIDVAKAPESYRINSFIGKSYKNQGEKYLENSPLYISNYSKAIQYLKKSIEIYPTKSDDLLYSLGHTYSHLKMHKEAIDCYERAILIKGEFWYRSSINLGLEFESVGRFDESLKVFQEVLKSAPEDIKALLALGRIYLHLKQVDESEKRFNKVLKLTNNKSVDAWNNLGVIYTREKMDYKKAKECFLKAYTLNPNDKVAQKNYEALKNY